MLSAMMRHCLLGLFVLCSAPGAQAADAPLLAYGARIAGDDARTRVVIDFDKKPVFFVHYVANPARVIVDLPETSFGLKPEDLAARGLFSEIRYGAMGAGSSRVVLTAKKPVAITVADVKADEEGRGFRLVLDAERVTEERFSRLIEEQKWTGTVTATKTDRVVEPPAAGE
jgi:N-acetylmuramoyl-L-alanine amidase